MITPSCDRTHGCITCSDEGVPMRVISAGDDGLALCEDERGRQQEVMTGIVGEVTSGDALLVHAGTALIRLRESVA